MIRDDGEVLLRLGEPPSPVPGPVADILLNWIGSRTNMRTATNRDSAWLFPGRRPPSRCVLITSPRWSTSSASPRQQGGFRDPQHVLEMPAPVVADALSYCQGHRQAGRPGRRHLQPLRPRHHRRSHQAQSDEGDS